MSGKSKHSSIELKKILLASMVIVALAAVLCACNKPQSEAADTSSCYDIIASYDDENGVLTASQEILYTSLASEPLDKIVLHVYANAFAKDNGKIDILSAQINKQTVDYVIYGKDNTLLSLPCSISGGQTCTINIDYSVTLPKKDGRLGITQSGGINLTCFYPVVAVYENGWREDTYSAIGDPFYTEQSSFFVSFDCPEKYLVASSGTISDQTVTDGVRSVEIEAYNVRDFGMAIGSFTLASQTAQVANRQIAIDYYFINDATPAYTLERASLALQTFSSVFGDYIHDRLCIVQSGLEAGGMEYGGFIIIAPNADSAQYLDTVTHETAHQWWYNAVGSDQLNAAWLDEGLTEFCTSYFYYLNNQREAHYAAMSQNEAAYTAFYDATHAAGFDGKMNKHLDEFLTQGEYVAVTYLKGAMLFETIRTLIGDSKFNAALCYYYNANKNGIATQDSLIAAFKTQGYDLTSIFAYFTD